MPNESLYIRRSRSYSADFAAANPEAFKAFGAFNAAVFADRELSLRVKELIAVAVAHITGCPYCIEAHVRKAKAAGVDAAELFEASAVAAAVSAHSSFYNGLHALNAYEDSRREELYIRADLERIGRLEDEAPEAYTAFFEYVEGALRPVRLTLKEKLLIAAASAHVTGSAYSIEIFAARLRDAGASLAEAAEAVLSATALAAGGVLAHRVHTIAAYGRE
ncbi:carboxymuconolactone decarboxylase family protein [Saccharibacillus sp. CPCC 101409]|uniref:carboxymuconolactone decarboxylase family protein n=1 Tax=Saccharibacillus sp. CPCC 101409 TaxID=3058041 RepID=UPI00267319FA|nr:carboxymuconolactone decarboxylase family protein [Saccharibacillus sp. CPCC 101409]MDO3408249.1 carboxymuconolactone decarboxylase family protein [Saccharibacillus sp. CPCC 101409]